MSFLDTIISVRQILREWAGLSQTIAAINPKLDKIMKQLEDLEAQVKKNEEVEAGAVELIKGIADKLAAAGTDASKLDALRAELTTSADTLAAAITANTPAEDAPAAAA